MWRFINRPDLYANAYFLQLLFGGLKAQKTNFCISTINIWWFRSARAYLCIIDLFVHIFKFEHILDFLCIFYLFWQFFVKFLFIFWIPLVWILLSNFFGKNQKLLEETLKKLGFWKKPSFYKSQKCPKFCEAKRQKASADFLWVFKGWNGCAKWLHRNALFR